MKATVCLILRKILFSLCLALLVISSLSCTKRPSGKHFQRLASQYFEYLSNEDFDSAAVLFHYPSDYTQEKLTNDKNSLSKMLNLLNNEFGKVLNTKRIDSLDNYSFVVVSRGDIPYWNKHPQSFAVFYDVEFGHEGHGHMIFYFCNINRKWEIRKVAYCLPKSRADTLSRIREIGGKMLELLVPYQDQEVKTGRKEKSV